MSERSDKSSKQVMSRPVRDYYLSVLENAKKVSRVVIGINVGTTVMRMAHMHIGKAESFPDIPEHINNFALSFIISEAAVGLPSVLKRNVDYPTTRRIMGWGAAALFAVGVANVASEVEPIASYLHLGTEDQNDLVYGLVGGVAGAAFICNEFTRRLPAQTMTAQIDATLPTHIPQLPLIEHGVQLQWPKN